MRIRGVARRWAAAMVAVATVTAIGLPVVPAGAAGPVTVMPLGDSLTVGYPDPPGGGYRVPFEDTLLAEGHTLDFVGSASNGPADLADKDHEGNNGDTISDVSARVGAALTANPAEVVLLMIGTNDTKDTEWVDAATAHAELATLIDQITAAGSVDTLAVSSIPPLPNATRDGRVQAYNAGLPGVIDAARADGDDVRFVDAYAAVPTAEVVDSSGHLSAAGNAIVAGLFRNALTDYYPPVASGEEIVAWDDFDRADSTAGLGAAPLGGTWSETGATWGLQGGEASVLPASGTGETIATLDTGSPDATVSATVTLSPDGVASPGLTMRAVDAGNQLLVGLTKRTGRDDVSLYSRIGGVYTALALQDGLGLVFGESYLLEASVSGPDVRVSIDGAEVLTHTLTGAAHTDLFSATRHGLRTSLGTAEDGGSRWRGFQVTAPTGGPANLPPTAEAGAPQTVSGDAAVGLTGSASDVDGTVDSYAWTQVGGPTVALADAGTASPSFTAPAATASPQVLTFLLTATDDDGAVDTDRTTVTVEAVPAEGRETVVRDSFDRADGALGSTNTGQAWSTAGATWVVDDNRAAASGAGEGLALVDTGFADVDVSSTVTLSTTGNASPGFALRAADADNYLLVGAVLRPSNDRVSLFKREGGTFTLLAEETAMGLEQGSTYALEARMDGSTVEIWWEGSLLFSHTLSVDDQALYGESTQHGLRTQLGTADDGGSRWDDLLITAAVEPPPNVAPVADAGADQTVGGGDVVTLDGAASSDADGTIAGYAWVQTGGPGVALIGAGTATASFTAPTATATSQVLTFELTVTDDDGATDTDTVTVTVAAEVTSPGEPCDESIAGAGFTDVGSDNLHAAAINCIAFYDITVGEAPTTYDPAGRVTRAQMASFIARLVEAAGASLPAGTATFTDVAPDNVHARRIHQLAEAGIVNGVGDGRFDPDGYVTRGQMAVFIARAHEFVTGTAMTGTHSFTDVAGSVHEADIAKLATAGITTGRTPTTYEPGADVRRDQMASFLARTLDSLASAGHTIV